MSVFVVMLVRTALTGACSLCERLLSRFIGQSFDCVQMVVLGGSVKRRMHICSVNMACDCVYNITLAQCREKDTQIHINQRTINTGLN